MIIITASPILKLIIDGGHIHTCVGNEIISPPRHLTTLGKMLYSYYTDQCLRFKNIVYIKLIYKS